MKSKIKLISAICMGRFNDTMVYDAVIEYLDKKVDIEIDKFWDSSREKDLWKIQTDLNLNYDTKKAIIEIISKDMPEIFSDIEPKEYNIEIQVENNFKSIQGWKDSKENYLDDYLHIGDKVDQSIVDYFINTLPPIVCNSGIIQMGEPYSSDCKGKNTYLTIAKDEPFGDWIYKGACLVRETINKEYKFEEFEIAEEIEIEKEIGDIE